MFYKFLILTCVFVGVIGQIMFKSVSNNYNQTHNIFSWNVLGLAFLACFMYLISTTLWVWTLRFVKLSVAYPFFALAFVLVPTASFFLFNEPITSRYILGCVLIIAGLIVMNT